MSDQVILEGRALEKSYKSTSVLSGVDLTVKSGESVAILGRSGSGKSTLLHLLGGLLSPDAGGIYFKNQLLSAYGEKERNYFRNQLLGFIYQRAFLLQEFTALENVLLPLKIQKRGGLSKAQELLEQVGLSGKVGSFPGELSGGEAQRVAVARALVTEPQLILADEPTGNLDQQNAQMVFEILLALTRQKRVALVVVTHDLTLAKLMDRCLCLNNGLLTSLG